MRTLQGKLLTIIAVGLLFALASFGQTSNLNGSVIGADGKPMVGAQIRIDRTDIKNTYNVKTDKGGKFVYANLPTGVYTVTLQVNGKDVQQLQGLHPKQGDNPPLNFDLSKPPEAAGAPPMTPAELAALEAKRKAQEAAMASDKALQEAFNAGMQAKTNKNWDAAVDNLKKASQIDPKQHVVWANLGDVYVGRADTKKGSDQESDLNESMLAYEKAMELTPESAVYHNNYARSLARAKKTDQAMAEMAKAAQLDPLQGGNYYYNMGTLFANMQRNDLAEQSFKKAIELDPTNAEAYYQFGVTQMQKATIGKDNKVSAPAGTEEAFQKYLALKPAGPDADAAKAMLDSMGATVKTTLDKKGKGGK
jgi:tetratricopeptide (TPR) repeat protein